MVLLFYMNIKQPNIKANTLYTMQQVEKINTGFILKAHVVAVINIVERNTHRLKKICFFQIFTFDGHIDIVTLYVHSFHNELFFWMYKRYLVDPRSVN